MTATAPGLAQGAIQPAIYQLLAGDALLAALVDARIYDAVPEPTVNNYVAIGEWTEDADDTLEADDAGLGSNATLTIHVYTDDARGSAGYKAGQAIAARVVRLLHRAPLAVQGFDTVTCEHETTDSFRDEDFAGKPKRHFVSTFRIITEAVPTSLMPYERPDLLLEFVPAINDATSVASSGGAFTKSGTPTLQGEGYAIDPGDAIQFSRALMDRLLNEGADGFTLMFSVKAVALVGSDFTYFAYTTPAGDGAFYFALVAGLDAGHARVTSGLSYNSAHYEWINDAGAMVLGAHVVTVRYRRAQPLGSRLSLYVDLVEVTGTPGFDAGTDPAQIAGTIASYPTGAVILGDIPTWAAAPNSPDGALWGWKTALSDADIALAAAWVAANHPLA